MLVVTRPIAIWLLVVVWLFPIRVHAQAPSTAATDGLQTSIHECEHDVSTWQGDADLQITSIVLIISFGAVVAALQASKSKGEVTKKIVLALGIGSSILGAVNAANLFPADYRTLRNAVLDGTSIIGQMYLYDHIIGDGQTSQQNRDSATTSFKEELTEFAAIRDRLKGVSASQPTATTGVLSIVYAQSAVPTWVEHPPQDDRSLYFIGTATSSDLAKAKENSVDDAYHNAVLALRSGAPKASDAALLSQVKGSGKILQSELGNASSNGRYVYYTLLLLSKQAESIGISPLPNMINAETSLIRFQKSGWRPADLTSSASSGMFVLDMSGGVSRLVPSREAPSIEKLFHVDQNYNAIAIAANDESVFVAGNSALGCTVYKYSLMTRAVDKQLMANHENCAGIATNGNTLYIAMPLQKEIRYWDDWTSHTSRSWSFASLGSPTNMVFDSVGRRLIVAFYSGDAYAVSISDGKAQLLASNLGRVTSLAASRFDIIAASGKKLLFTGRFEDRRENPPNDLQSLTGGQLVGVAVDAADQLWFADFDQKLVEGPFPLS